MSGRSGRYFRDPISDSTERTAATEGLYNALNTLSELHASVISLMFGLVDGEPRTTEDIAEVHGLTVTEIRQIQSKAMSTLRTRCGGMLLDYLDVKGAAPIWRLTDRQLRTQFQTYITQRKAEFYQAQQEAYGQHRDRLGQCLQCNAVFSKSDNGRPRKYCSPKCKQAAYRHRRNSEAQRSRIDPATLSSAPGADYIAVCWSHAGHST